MKKTNKTFKRFAAITSASLLAACAVAPVAFNAFAEGEDPVPETVSYSMKLPSLPTNSSISSVKAYKIFNGEYIKSTNTFNVTSWASADTLSSILAKLPDGAVKTALSADGLTAQGAAEIIAGYTNNATNLEIFAKAAAEALTSGGVDGTVLGADTAETTDDAVQFDKTAIGVGYYVVLCDVTNTSDEDVDTYTSKSLGMLTVTGAANTQIGNGTAKVGLPKVEKKVQEDQKANFATDLATYETSDKSWNDVADYDIGDAVPFKLYGTMPDNLDKYSAYYYCFNDTLDTQFDKPTNVIITIEDTKLYYMVDGGDDNGTMKWSYIQCDDTFKTKITESNKDKNCSVEYDVGKFTVAFEDIKAYEGVDKTTVVTVEYNSVLNKTAVVGNPGQNNKVDLTYSNNPNVNYKPTTNDDTSDSPENGNTGKTPEDIVNVLTYAFKFEKTFFNAANEKLTVEELETGVFTGDKAAQFTLYAGEGAGKTQLRFTKVESTDTVNYGTYDYIIDKNGTLTTLELTEIGGNDGDLTTRGDNNLVIRIKGLDEGKYTLSETRAPEGYNPADDQVISITAGTKNGQSWNGTDETLESFSWKIDETEAGNQSGNAINATATAEMQNKKGTTLPGTGGIGTTIFYLGGGAMAAIGGVYLISKRRMKKSEE